jgi:hypothetical protein
MSDAAVRKEIGELRARGDHAAARQRLKTWRLAKEAANSAKNVQARRADRSTLLSEARRYEQWLDELELSLLTLHEDTSGRTHRLPFASCRRCDALRQSAMRERKSQQLARRDPS